MPEKLSAIIRRQDVWAGPALAAVVTVVGILNESAPATIAGLTLGVVALAWNLRKPFSLRTLLIAMIVVSAFLGWLGWRLQRVREIDNAIAKLNVVGASAGRFKSVEIGPRPYWLRIVAGEGEGVRWNVFMGHWSKSLKARDETIATLMPSIQTLDPVHVDMSFSLVTNEALRTIGNVKSVKSLRLTNTGIDDNGIMHLAELPQLARVDLIGTNVTPVGVARLQQALPNCEIITSFGRMGSDPLGNDSAEQPTDP